MTNDVDMQEDYNAAINFALDETEQVEDTRLFLSMWREGDWSAIDETFPEFEISDRLRNAHIETDVMSDHKVHCTCGAGRGVTALLDDYRGLQARIILARRLIKCGQSGFVDDALTGNDLSKIELYPTKSLLEHLNDCEKGEQP